MSTEATAAEMRAWARQNGIPVGSRGRIDPYVKAAYAAAHPTEHLAEWERELLAAEAEQQ